MSPQAPARNSFGAWERSDRVADEHREHSADRNAAGAYQRDEAVDECRCRRYSKAGRQYVEAEIALQNAATTPGRESVRVPPIAP